MKTKIYTILEYNEYHKNYIDVFTTNNYRLAINKYNYLIEKYEQTQFILVEVLEC